MPPVEGTRRNIPFLRFREYPCRGREGRNDPARGRGRCPVEALERSDPGDTFSAGTVGLAFPVALFSTYPFVWEFAENLAPGRGKEIFMVDTLAGFSGGVVGLMKRVVSARLPPRRGRRNPNAHQLRQDRAGGA